MSSSLETRPGPSDAGFFTRTSVPALAADLRAGRLSPRDLVETALAEAARRQPELNAFITLDEAGARAAADRAILELADGVDRGPLHGLPAGVKDVLDVAGLPTTAGSRHLAGHVATRDAESVRRLREAGVIVLGKTATHEFACGPTGDRAATGPARNPWATDRMTGGSSSGSAAAVAAGIVPLALGTDTGGSVRVPSACCGTVGLKPTSATTDPGLLPLAPSFDTVGPVAGDITGCRLLWTVLSGQQPAPGGSRIAWVRPDFPVDPEIVRLTRPHAGEEVTIRGLADLRTAYRTIQGREAHTVHTGRLATAPQLYDNEVRERLQAGAAVTEAACTEAWQLRDRVRAVVTDLFRHHDFLALPTIPLVAPPIDARTATIGTTTVDVVSALLALTSPWSVLGLPALSVPAGFAHGLPVGLQLVGPPGSEHRLLTTAEHLFD
ncbi:MAG TPA: amidase [Amycolatopsis sp.]|nr:amidase [Amycolatopsis sp.]